MMPRASQQQTEAESAALSAAQHVALRAWRALREHWPLALIMAVALAARLLGSSANLPYLYSPGESIVVRQALAYGSTRSLRPYTYIYPPLYSYLLFVLYGLYYVLGRITGAFATVSDLAISYFMDPTPFYLIGRIVTGLMGSGTVLLVYLIAARTERRATGLVAAALLAVSHLHIVHSHNVLTDIPMTCMVMLAMWLILRARETDSRQGWVWAGLGVGAAIGMKYNAALMLIPLVLGILWPANARPAPVTPRVPLRQRLAPLAVGLGSVVAGFVITCPFALLDWRALWTDLMSAQLGLNTGIAKSFGETMAFYWQTLLRSGMGYPLGIWALLGLAYAVWRHRPHDLLLLSFPVSYLLFLGFQGRYQANWLLPALPFLCIFAAALAVDLVDRLRLPQRARRLALGLLTIVLAAYPAWFSFFYLKSIAAPDTRSVAKAWIEAHIPAGSRILLDSSSTGPPLQPTLESWQRYFDQAATDKEIASRSLAAQTAFDSYRHYQLEAARRLQAQVITYDLEYMQLAWWRASEEEADLEDFPVFGAYRERIFSLAQLQQAGIEYVVVSSFKYRQYLTPEGQAKWPSYYEFYDSLDKHARLIQAFYADPIHQPGPDIKIYALRQGP